MNNNTVDEPGWHNYQVLHVVSGKITTRLSFWADDDYMAAKLAGVIPSGAILARVVQDVQR